jgi:hypothetical protein
MRFSNEAATTPETMTGAKLTSRALATQVSETHGAAALHGALVLVGGNDWRSLALRRAQAPLRFDRRPSLWSHVALIAQWNAEDPGQSVGLEVSLEPHDVTEQAPERNGVTSFKLARYLDAARYPNLAIVAIDLGRGEPARSRRSALLDAACNPCRDRERFPLWSSLSTWARYAYAPELIASPLQDGIAMPSAAFCEYAFEAAGVDLTPGASGNHASPELLWATITHWQSRMRDQASFSATMIMRDPGAAMADALPMTITLPEPPPRKPAGAKRARKKRSR